MGLLVERLFTYHKHAVGIRLSHCLLCGPRDPCSALCCFSFFIKADDPLSSLSLFDLLETLRFL